MTTATTSALDEAVEHTNALLDDAEVPAPDLLLLMATGVDLFAENLRDPRTIELAGFAEVPERWRSQPLIVGGLGASSVWLIDDVSAEPGAPERAPWQAGFPIWLAAAGGASVCVHTSAGSPLPASASEPGASAVPSGGFALVRDHINLSGDSPLRGLGESRLGPLFPDQSHVHHLGLRRAALEHAERLGLQACEAIAACTAGPTLETAAERRMLRTLGAEVSVQGLAAPLITAAHAGLAVLALVAVTDAFDAETTDVARLLEHAASAQPALEDLLLALTEHLAAAVQARGTEAT